MKKNVLRGLAFLFASLIFLGATAGQALETNRNVVDDFLGTKSYVVETDTESGELYSTFTADYANTTELVAAHEAMGEQLMEEGGVLLKNNGSLPLASESRKVTLLGIRAEAKTLYGATIGVNVPAAQHVSLTTALNERGFTVNSVMNDIYQTITSDKSWKNANKFSASFSGVQLGQEPVYDIREVMVEEMAAANPAYLDSVKQYNDAAIVVFGRPGSEAGDYYPGSVGVDTASGARNPLALCDDERALLAFAEENFETVGLLAPAGFINDLAGVFVLRSV